MNLQTGRLWVFLTATLLAMTLLVAACAPGAAPTPTPTNAPAAASPTAAPKAEPTKPAEKPAEKPAATPTTAPSKPTGASIKVGFLTPLSGFAAPFGHNQKYGVILAQEDINQGGGINGSPLEVLTRDSPFDPKEAVTLMRNLDEKDKVFAILGPYSSGEFEVAAPLANELQIPTITNLSLKPGVTAANRPWTFRVQLVHDITLPVAIDAFKKKYPAVKKVVIVGDTKEAVNQVMVKDLFPKMLQQAGFDLIGTVEFNQGTTDFGAIVTKAKESNAQGIAVAGIPTDVATLAKEMARQGFQLPTVTGAQIMGSNFPQMAGTSVEGWVAAGTFDPASSDPAVQKFVSRISSRMETDAGVVKPIWLAYEPQTYDTVMAMADIMRKAAITPNTAVKDARTKIRDGFQNLKDYPGLVGSISVLPTGETTWKPVPFVVQGGKWVAIK
ncbi:MAG: ABC transporter substrate-binding protein [Dehalococcoidia bacterium]|nr:ABC transporter substrate-binding protein [Dehalococcoidia bacterium]